MLSVQTYVSIAVIAVHSGPQNVFGFGVSGGVSPYARLLLRRVAEHFIIVFPCSRARGSYDTSVIRFYSRYHLQYLPYAGLGSGVFYGARGLTVFPRLN